MTLDEFKKQYVNTNVFTNEITADAKSVLQVLTEFETYIKTHAIQGPTGSDGISITNVELEDKGNNLYQLNVTLSDGNTVNAGTFTSAPGPKGDKGDTGETGATPDISVTAATLPAGSSAIVTKSGTPENPVFAFGIPKGDKGDKGDTGEPGPVGPAGSATADDITIDQPESATNGKLTSTQLATLQASKLNGIIFANERYILQDNQHESGFLVYSHVGHDSTGNFFVKCITITISTLAWVLSSTAVGAGGDIEIVSGSTLSSIFNSIDENALIVHIGFNNLSLPYNISTYTISESGTITYSNESSNIILNGDANILMNNNKKGIFSTKGITTVNEILTVEFYTASRMIFNQSASNVNNTASSFSFGATNIPIDVVGKTYGCYVVKRKSS